MYKNNFNFSSLFLGLASLVFVLFISCAEQSGYSSLSIRIPKPPTQGASLQADSASTIRLWLSQDGKLVKLGATTQYMQQSLNSNAQVTSIEIPSLPTGDGYKINIGIGLLNSQTIFKTQWLGTSALFSIAQKQSTEVPILVDKAPQFELLKGTDKLNCKQALGTILPTSPSTSLIYTVIVKGKPTDSILVSTEADKSKVAQSPPISKDSTLQGSSSNYKEFNHAFSALIPGGPPILAVSTDDGLIMISMNSNEWLYNPVKAGSSLNIIESQLYFNDIPVVIVTSTQSIFIGHPTTSPDFSPSYYTIKAPEGESIEHIWVNSDDLYVKTTANFYIHENALANPEKWSPQAPATETLSQALSVFDKNGTKADVVINDLALNVKNIPMKHDNQIALYGTDKGIFYTSYSQTSGQSWIQVPGTESLNISRVYVTPMHLIKDETTQATINSESKALIVTKDGSYYILSLNSPGDDKFATLSKTTFKLLYLGFQLSLPDKINSITAFGKPILNSDELTPAFLLATESGTYIMTP